MSVLAHRDLHVVSRPSVPFPAGRIWLWRRLLCVLWDEYDKEVLACSPCPMLPSGSGSGHGSSECSQINAVSTSMTVG